VKQLYQIVKHLLLDDRVGTQLRSSDHFEEAEVLASAKTWLGLTIYEGASKALDDAD